MAGIDIFSRLFQKYKEGTISYYIKLYPDTKHQKVSEMMHSLILYFSTSDSSGIMHELSVLKQTKDFMELSEKDKARFENISKDIEKSIHSATHVLSLLKEKSSYSVEDIKEFNLIHLYSNRVISDIDKIAKELKLNNSQTKNIIDMMTSSIRLIG